MKLISQEICFRQTNPCQAVYESACYTRREGADMMRIRFQELKDDIFDDYTVELSADNGLGWSGTQHWERGQQAAGGVLRRMFLSSGIVDPATDRLLVMGLEGVFPNDRSLDGMTRYHPVYKVSEDAGRTWSMTERAIQKGEQFSAEHPFEGVWEGKNALMPANAAVVTKDGAVLVPCNASVPGSDGGCFCPPGAWTFTTGAVMIGRWRADGRMDWDLSAVVEIPLEKSLRGAIEPTLAQMPDGRILMVLRANDGTVEKNGGRKWFCTSRDGGCTWDEPRCWTYADGAPFYSPSSISRLIRHSKGNIYWFGNICPDPPQGNAPRYPLVVGRVDQETLLLERDSLFTVDTRKPDDQDTLQLSNFSVHEDRLTGDLVLRMTRWDGGPSGGGQPIDANVHLYRIAAR